jgi:hypothetical protein
MKREKNHQEQTPRTHQEKKQLGMNISSKRIDQDEWQVNERKTQE